MKKTVALFIIVSIFLLFVSGCTPDNNAVPQNGNGTGVNPDNTEIEGGNNTEKPHTYTSFTSDEQELLNSKLGFVIPFIANSEYTLKAIDNDTKYKKGFVFLTEGNEDTEFDAYKNSLKSYTYHGSSVDESGRTWYWYNNEGYCIDTAFYTENGTTFVEVRIYSKDYATEDRKPIKNESGDCDVDFGDAL